MPESIVSVTLKLSPNRLRLEWGMRIEKGQFVFPLDVLQVRLYCRPFLDFGEPRLIFPPLSRIAYTRTRGTEGSAQAGITQVLGGSIGGSAGWGVTQEAFRPGAPTEPEGERYGYYPLELHLKHIRRTTNNGTVWAKVEWPIEDDWMAGSLRCWASLGYLVPMPGSQVGDYTEVATSAVYHHAPASEPEPAVTVDPAIAPSVFISYERDAEAAANRIRTYLQSAGIAVWQDTDKIRGTARWRVDINEALHDTERLILLLTPGSMQSEEVFNEWSFFYSERKPIHCLLLEPCDIFYTLRPFQYLDWREPAQRNWSRLADDLLAPFEWPSVALKEKVINSEFAPARSLPETLQALHDALLNSEGIVAVSDEQLAEVQAHRPTNETELRLMRYAAWCGSRYQLDERFVRLTMYVDQGSKAQQRFTEHRRFTDLRDVLAEEPARALVLLGDPGAGKSTLLRRLEMDTALDALRNPEQRVLTFYMSLSEYGLDVTEDAPLKRPFEWLSEKWGQKYPTLPPLQALLQDQRMLLLLDSLNEMPHTDRDDFERKAHLWRAFIYDWVRDLPGNRAIFACRTLDYGAVLSTDQYPVPQVRVEEMTPREVRDYLDNYAPDQANLIWDAFEQEPRLFEVFRIPFMLNMLVERVKLDGRIPEGRAETFNGFVYELARRELVDRHNPLFEQRDTLLTSDEIDLLRDLPTPPSPYYLPDAGLLIPSLIVLASAMQERKPGSEQSQVEVTYKEAMGWLPPTGRERDVLKAGCDMSVLDRKDRLYIRYYHQLIQEFFAARKLAYEPDPELVRVEWHVERVSPTLEEELNRIADSDPLPLLPGTGWEETAVMAAAMSRDPDGYLRGLMEANLPLAGRCAAAPDIDANDALCEEIRWALVARTQDPSADLRARIAAGLALGVLGDPRFTHGTGPEGDAYLLPPMIPIEGGEYTLGSDDGFYDDEAPVHPVTVDPFEIAQFPVTNAEYKLFMDADGYEEEQWWETEAANAWRRGEGTAEGPKQQSREDRAAIQELLKTGRLQDLYNEQRITSEQARQWEQIAQMDEAEFEVLLDEWYPAGRQTQPDFWDSATYNNPAQPVVGVSWHEARAYCAWLSAQAQQTFRLPTEAEWEAAARGKEARRYPYGPDFDVTRSNTFESHIRRTTPVGIFPGGETPAGLVDMSGNVYDWTTSIYDPERFPYPYRADDGRENSTDTAARRVVRGGSWNFDQDVARAACRYGSRPDGWNGSIGFRVVRVPHL